MKIKAKLSLGVGLLFLFIILLAVIATVYINALNKDTQNILVSNYNTLDYSRCMLIALDEDLNSPESFNKFSENLYKQQSNITEIGEKELTDNLSSDFNKLKKDPSDRKLYISIRKDLTDIMKLNMQAIERKSNIAKNTANNATWRISILGTVCFLLAFILLVNLPGNIANPIKELTESIKQIAIKNYKERVHFEGHNEFGELAQAFNVMAQKLEEYDNSKLAKILFEKKRIDTLINKLHDPVVGLDENQTILFVNAEAYKITGLKHDEMIGKNAKDIALTNDLMRFIMVDLVVSNRSSETLDDIPIKIFTDNKESYFIKEIIDITITPTGEQSIKHIGHVIMLRNITPFKELEFAKTNFIATVSHEFKTPISSIKMGLQLLENEKTGMLNKGQKNLLNSIKEDTDRLLNITGELLNISQVESGNIQVNIVSADPKEILLNAVNTMKTQADQKQINFEITYAENISKVQADAEKTIWVLNNLISNAIHYSSESSRIYLKIASQNNKIQFIVQDEGQGIAPQYLSKIFDRFFRVPGTMKEGTGLGLAISKEYIEAQGGYIDVESELEKGSIFTVTLNCQT